MNIKLVAMDLDGTLLDEQKAVSEVNIGALRACEARGIMAVMSSGRAHESIRMLAHTIGLNSPIVSANGARVDASPDGPMIMVECFDRPMAERVFDIALKDGVLFVIYAPGAMYQLNLDGYEDENRGLNRGLLRVGREFTGGAEIRVVRDRAEAFEKGLSTAMKFVMFNKSPARLAALRAQYESLGLSLSSSDDESLEVMMPGAGKGRAIEFLMRHYGLGKDQVMVFGDYTNDITMFEAAGYPVAMGNAVEELKRIAWKVAPSNQESGVGRMINEYVLGGSA